VSRGFCPIEDSGYSLPNAPGRLRFGKPNRRKHPEDIRGFNLIDALLTHDRENMELKAGQPLRCMLLVSPAGAMLFKYGLRSFGECRNLDPHFTASLYGVAAISREFPIFQGFGSGLSQGYQAQSTQADVAALPLNDGAKNPPLCAARVDDQVQAVAVTIAPRDGEAVHAEDRQGFMRMLSGNGHDHNPYHKKVWIWQVI
jgi:hypothetical protein